ncbi:hypothetical protein FIBSPDRAFT_701936, partial [Athelia psychrophila]
LVILCGSSNTQLKVCLDAGKSRNTHQNCIFLYIVSLMSKHSLWITSLYVLSQDNLAHVPSRGLP